MRKFFLWFIEETKNLFPVFVFFLVAFSLMHLTDILLKRNVIGTYIHFSVILFDALLMAKVFLIAESIGWINLFSDKLYFYNALWKTCIYGLVVFLVRLFDLFMTQIYSTHLFMHSGRVLMLRVEELGFWVLQLWLLLLLFMFVFTRELIHTKKINVNNDDNSIKK